MSEIIFDRFNGVNCLSAASSSYTSQRDFMKMINTLSLLTHQEICLDDFRGPTNRPHERVQVMPGPLGV